MEKTVKQGIKHLVDCSCILPQFTNQENPTFHKIVVFSVLNEEDNVIEKFIQCVNCGVIHRVFDLCKSEILFGKEKLDSVMSIDDIKLSFPEKLSNVLQTYNVDLPTWEEVQFVMENNIFPSNIVLSSETSAEYQHGKVLKIIDANLFKIEPFNRRILL